MKHMHLHVGILLQSLKFLGSLIQSQDARSRADLQGKLSALKHELSAREQEVQETRTQRQAVEDELSRVKNNYSQSATSTDDVSTINMINASNSLSIALMTVCPICIHFKVGGGLGALKICM